MPQPVAQRCFHCQTIFPFESMVPGEMLRPAIIETIKKRDTSWASSQWQKLLEIQQIQMDFMKELMRRGPDSRSMN